MKFIFILMAMISLSAFGQIIYPDGQFGKIQYQKAQHSVSLQEKAQILRITFTSDVSKKTISLEEGVAYKVPKGTGCLKLTAQFKNKKQYETSKCNIKIEAEKTSVETLSSVFFFWHNEKLKTDFGKRVGARVKRSKDCI